MRDAIRRVFHPFNVRFEYANGVGGSRTFWNEKEVSDFIDGLNACATRTNMPVNYQITDKRKVRK